MQVGDDISRAAHAWHPRCYESSRGEIKIGQPVVLLHHGRENVVPQAEVQGQLG